MNFRIIVHVILSDWPLDIVRDACRLLGDSENVFANELPSVIAARTIRSVWPDIFISKKEAM